MKICSYHLVRASPLQSLGALYRPPTRGNTSGLLHAECMAAMTLGAPALSPERLQLRRLALFAAWESEAALDAFLEQSKHGRIFAGGWHVRLQFIRRWGHFSELKELVEDSGEQDPSKPVVAVTLARLKLPQVFRFVRWGRPVEEQVRDHPGTTLALATYRPLRTFSTFSIWRSQREMTDMVHGHQSAAGGDRHARAMQERDRKDFHHQFTTLRFRALSEHGTWEGKTGFVPECPHLNP